MMSTITDRGQLSFMVFQEHFTAGVCLRFLRRLVRHAGRKVFLVLDRHPVHRSAKVKRWLAANSAKIAGFFLPSYSPDLNRDELLNQDVKRNALGRQRPANWTEMIADLRFYLRSTQREPGMVKSYF